MASGRWAGIAVRPRPLQSTMLLLQEHIGGQDPDARLQGWTKALPPFPTTNDHSFNTHCTNDHTFNTHCTRRRHRVWAVLKIMLLS